MKKIIITAAVGLLCSSAMAANDLMLTTAANRGGAASSIDLVSEGNVTMMQFRIDTGATEASQVDLSKCTASLPKSHKGECSFAKGVVLGLIYNDEGVTLPAGVINIGKITVKSGSAAPKVVEFLAADKSNAPVQGAIRSDDVK